jgi:DNA-binding CsgD family transcriptional regulator
MCVEDNRNISHDGKGVIILAPKEAKIVSYHASGKSSKELFLEQRNYAKALLGEFRL